VPVFYVLTTRTPSRSVPHHIHGLNSLRRTACQAPRLIGEPGSLPVPMALLHLGPVDAREADQRDDQQQLDSDGPR
jgi:hypothetical protein